MGLGSNGFEAYGNATTASHVIMKNFYDASGQKERKRAFRY